MYAIITNIFRADRFPIIIFLFFVLFIAVYFFLFFISPALGPTDDFIFLRTLQVEKPLIYWSDSFPYYDWLGLGRFTPLGAMEYNLMAFISASPFWYFTYHALQFLIFIFLFIILLKHIISDRRLIYGLTVLLTLLPAFSIPFFRLQMNERNVLFFLTLFLFLYLAYLNKPKLSYLALGVFAANIVIYYKETAFILIGAFAFSYFVLTWKTSSWRTKSFNIALMASSAFYLVLYYFLVFRNLGEATYLTSTFNWLLVAVKNIINYGFFSDPIIILLLLPLTVWRIYTIFYKHKVSHPFFDSMLFAGSMYVLAYFILNIYSPYFFLPVYVLALPALLYFLIYQGMLKVFFWKGMLILTTLLLSVNTLPAGLHYLTYYKYLPVNFNKTLDFLIEEISEQNLDQKPSLFLDGVDMASGRATYFVMADFLTHKGLDTHLYDFKSNTTTANPSPLLSLISFPFTVFTSDHPSEIQSGDFLIITPQRTVITQGNRAKDFIHNSDYKLVFNTESPFAFPNITLKSYLKAVILTRLSETQKKGGVVVNEMIWESPDYFVFIKT